MATRQQFIFTNKTVGITTILFKNDNPFQNVEKIVFFKETGLTGNWLKKEFRYSFDDSTWSSWRTFTQSNLTSLAFNNQPEFYLEIKYTRSNYNTAGIDDLYIFYDSNTASPVDPSTAEVDANTLQGQPGSYYLDRANFTGPYTGLNIENVVDGSSAGVYFSRTDSSLGTTFYFKRIEGDGDIDVTDTSAGKIIISLDASIVGGVSYQNDDPTIEEVGGIPDGSTYFLSPKTFAQVMEDMFYPLAFPSFTNPYTQLTDDVTPNLQIIGAEFDIDLRSTLNRGTITPPYGTSGFRAGIGDAVYFNGPDVSVKVGSQPSSPHTYTITDYEVSSGYQTWTSYWDYQEGEQPKDSKGNDYDSPLPAGSTGTSSTQFEGVYPLYATTVNIDTLSIQPLVSKVLKVDVDFDMVAEPPFSGKKQKFEIAQEWINDSSILGIQYYVPPPFDEWRYEGGSAASSLTKWTATSAGTRVIEGKSVPYVRYTYNNTEYAGATTIRLKFIL